jgi:enoyl-CoA hydratase
MSLTDGLHVENTEFFTTVLSKDGQQLMLDFLEAADATGELPLYNPDTYKRALESGSVPRSANGR